MSRLISLRLRAGRGGRSGPEFVPTSGTAGALTRLVRALTPVDKIAVAHDQLRRAAGGAMVVALGGRVLGLTTLADLDRALSHPAWTGAGEMASEQLGALLGGPEPILVLRRVAVLSAESPVSRVREGFDADADSPLIAIVNEGGVYLGALLRCDLVAAELGNLAPPRVGGMATPLGVYLTDGVIHGGAGSFGLFLTGVTISALYCVAMLITGYGLRLMEQKTHIDLTTLLALTFLKISPSAVRAMADDLRGVLAIPLLLLFMRLVPLAGYHAAEHQVVHCMERGEPLLAENVRRMPRAHPRCGTNIVAGVLIFSLALMLLFGVTSSILQSVVPALVIVALTWRPVGTLLQNALTTRPASARQIESGIKAGREVMQRHLAGGIERRGSLAQRIWSMGLAPLLLGSWAMTEAVGLIAQYVPGASNALGQLGW